MQDPTADNMRAMLREIYSPHEADDFDIEAAIYWFASHYHGGQWSNLYSALSTSQYRPGPLADDPEPDSVEEYCYYRLCQEYAGD